MTEPYIPKALQWYSKPNPDGPCLLRVLGGGLTPGEVLAMAAHPDGESFWIATPNRISQHELSSGKLLAEVSWGGLYGTKKATLAFDGTSLLAACEYNQELRLYQLSGETLTQLATWHDNNLSATRWSPDGTVISFHLRSSNYRLNGVNYRWSQPERFQKLGTQWSVWLYSKDEPFLAVGRSGKTLKLYSSDGSKVFWSASLASPVVDCAYLDDQRALCCLEDGSLAEVSLQNGSLAEVSLQGGTLLIHQFKYQTTKILTSRDRIVLVAKHGARLLSKSLELLSELEESPSRLIGEPLLDPHGQWLVASVNSTLKRYNLPSWEEQTLGEGHSSSIVGLCWLDEQRLLSASRHERQVRIWDTSTGEVSWLTELPQSGAHRLCHLPDGRGFVIGDAAGVVSVYDFEWGSSMGRFETKREPPSALAVSPDGTLIFAAFSGLNRQALYAWRLGNTEPLWMKDLLPHGDPKAISTCGGWLTVFYSEKIARYHMLSGEELASAEVPAAKDIRGGVLSSDGETAVYLGYYETSSIGGYADTFYHDHTTIEQWTLFSDEPPKLLLKTELLPGLLSSQGSRFAYVDEHDFYFQATPNAVLSSGFPKLSSWSTNGYEACSVALSPSADRLAVGTVSGAILLFALSAPTAK